MIMLFLFQIVVAGIISFLMYRKTSNIDTENQSEIKDLACFVSSIRFYNLDNAKPNHSFIYTYFERSYLREITHDLQVYRIYKRSYSGLNVNHSSLTKILYNSC